jgi:cysteinylglycine-S-conjugate dipeptidase
LEIHPTARATLCPLEESHVSDLPDRTEVSDHLRDIAATVMEQLPETRAWLEELVRIPSISDQPRYAEECVRSAKATAALLEAAGLADVRLLEVEGAHPYVTGAHLDAGPDAPTVLLYAHHDVQPAATADRWSSPPFEPTERDGRLYGRGAADDKAGILAHVAAIRAWTTARGAPPCNVKVIVEGEEEIGSPHLPEFLEAHADELAADVIVLADLVNFKVGWPGLTWSLRGMADVRVTVRALERPVHSGMWGGPVPDALTGLVRLLASLHDERGEIAVAGFDDDVRPLRDEERARLEELGEDPEALRAEAGMLDGVSFIGDERRSLLERTWFRPTITPVGIDAPSVAEASNTLLARADAKLSVRLAPGQDPQRAVATLADHLRTHVPFGLDVEVQVGESAPAWVTEPAGPAWEAAEAAMTSAFGRAPAALGCGGSIPFAQPFSEAFGGAPCLLVGVEDPGSNAHGEDESLHLDDFARTCVAEALLLEELARRLG